MTKDQIQIYTRKIVESNSTGIIAILFDIYEAYSDDAKAAFEKNDVATATEELKKATEVISHLKNDLVFKYDISTELYALYDFCQRSISKSIYKGNVEGLLESDSIMSKLAVSFKKIAEKDSEKPVMKNSQHVIAGYTYGRNSLNEMVSDGTYGPRGFYA